MNKVSISLKKEGFSLVELLIAMLVFSILSLLGMRAVSVVSASAAAISVDEALMKDVQGALVLWEQDVRRSRNVGLIEQPGSSAEGEAEIAKYRLFSGSSLIGGADNGVTEVSYSVRGGKLVRGSSALEGEGVVLLSDVVSAKTEGAGHSEANAVGTASTGAKEMVALNIEHKQLGNIRRILFLGAAKEIGLSGLGLGTASGLESESTGQTVVISEGGGGSLGGSSTENDAASALFD